MKKTTEIKFISQSGLDVNITVERHQGYEDSVETFDGISYSQRNYYDTFDINLAIPAKGIKGRATRCDSSLIYHYDIGGRASRLRLVFTEDKMQKIHAACDEILCPDDAADYRERLRQAEEVEDRYTAYTRLMSKIMND